MVWFSGPERKPVMLMVRAISGRGFELVRLSEQSSDVLEVFDNETDAIQRWNEIEEELRR